MTSVPFPGLLREVARRSVAEFREDRCSLYASSIAYHVLFSIFPLAIVLAGVTGIVVHTTGTRSDLVDAIVRQVPLSAKGDARLRDLLEGATGNLSALGLLGVAGVVYAASGMMTSIRLALDAAFEVEESRSFVRAKLVDLGLLAVAAVLALVSLVLAIGARMVDMGAFGPVLGVVAPLGVSFALVTFLYRFVPSVEVRLRDAAPAAALVAVVFVLVETLFAVYVEHFANYNAIYGSLGAIIAFMFFVYLSSLVFLFGAEVAAELPRARGRLGRRVS